LRFGEPVCHVYNPLSYAWRPHCEYLRRFARQPEVLIVGMNAGYFGMAQTGVPFGDVVMVRDWLGIEARVERPEVEHPKRPIEGLPVAARCVARGLGPELVCGTAPHPSPANASVGANWPREMNRALAALNIAPRRSS